MQIPDQTNRQTRYVHPMKQIAHIAPGKMARAKGLKIFGLHDLQNHREIAEDEQHARYCTSKNLQLGGFHDVSPAQK